MSWMIFDSDGNALLATDDELEAAASLREIAYAARGLEDSFALFEYDEHGDLIGEARTVFDLPAATVLAQMNLIVVSTASGDGRRASRTIGPWFPALMWSPAPATSENRAQVA